VRMVKNNKLIVGLVLGLIIGIIFGAIVFTKTEYISTTGNCATSSSDLTTCQSNLLDTQNSLRTEQAKSICYRDADNWCQQSIQGVWSSDSCSSVAINEICRTNIGSILQSAQQNYQNCVNQYGS